MSRSIGPEDVAHMLMGTCKSLADVLEENDMEGAENDIGFCMAIDEIVFECERCNWWCSVDEMCGGLGDVMICEECGGD